LRRKSSMANKRLRFAIFGTGGFGTCFAQYVNEVAELVAICDPKPESRANFLKATGLKVPEFDDHERLLANVQVDAVVLTGPNHTHKPQAIASACAGKHVFCEKAMAPTVPDCWEMVRTCEAAKVRLMVGQKRRLRPPWSRMLDLRKQLGPLVAISTLAYWDARPDNFQGWWTREAESGGLLNLSGVHEIDWMRAMCGDVERVSALPGARIDSRYDFADSMHVMLQFRSGAIGFLGVSLSYPLLRYRQVCGAEVVGHAGGMQLVTSFNCADIHWRSIRDAEAHHERFEEAGPNPVGAEEALRRELREFVQWVTDGTEPTLTWREGLRCVEVMEAAHRSAKQGGTWMNLPLYPELEQRG
jgi:predicted dehydrogenase